MMVLRIHAPSSRRSGCERRRTGAAAVEAAVVMPVLAILLLGIIELSRALWGMDILEDAARAGARAGTYPGAGLNTASPSNKYQSITAAAQQVLSNNNITSTHSSTVTAGVCTVSSPTATQYGSPDYSQDPLTAQSGQGVAVTVTVNWSDLLYLAQSFVPANTTASKTAVMAKQ